MSNRYSKDFSEQLFLLPLSLFVLTGTLNAESVRAQAVDAVGVPNSVTPSVPVPDALVQPDILDRLEPPSQEPLQPPNPTPLPPPEELLEPSPAIPPTPEFVPGVSPETITIERFEFEGNTAFSDEELAKVTAEFTNRPISFAELFQARSTITQYYVDRGYITSGALIPPQTLEGGTVKIQVVEGKLQEIIVTGTRRLNPGYVRSRLAIAARKPLNQERLLEGLRLLELNPLIENLSAELSSGTEPGTNVLEVRVTEADTFNVQLAVDNNRNPSVGSFQRQVQVNQANLLGLGDSLSVGYRNTDGSNGVQLSYTLPINARNGTLSFNYGNTSSDVIETPFDELNIDASSRYYELTLRQPIVQTATQTTTREFTLGLTASRQESKVTFLEGVFGSPAVPFTDSPGADGQGRTRISAIRFFQEWVERNNREVIAARSQFSLGVGAFDATINDESPDSRFLSWRGQAQWVRRLAEDTFLLVRADVQLADRSLVPLEQIGLGGQETVRGYRQDIFLADNGVLASAEARIPILRIPEWEALVQVAPFVDFGAAWNNSDATKLDSNFLASFGLGLQMRLGDRVTARLDYGIPLVSVSSSDRTWQENGFYFAIVTTFF